MQHHHATVSSQRPASSGVLQSIPVHHSPQSIQILWTGTYQHVHKTIQHILTLLQHGHNSDNLTGCLLRGSLESLQLELSILGHVFALDYNTMHPLATQSWIKHTWQFQHTHDIRVMETDLPDLTLAWVNDQFLIPAFWQVASMGQN